MTPVDPFLGEWRQIRPDPDPASISVIFGSNGSVFYSVDTGNVQTLRLAWRLEGELLVIDSGTAPSVVSRFRFRSPTMLVLEREGQTTVYVRVSGRTGLRHA